MAMMKRTMALLLVLVTGLLLGSAAYANNPASTTNLKADNGDIAHPDYGFYIKHVFRYFDGDYLECTFYKRNGQPTNQTVTLTRKITVISYYNPGWCPLWMDKIRWDDYCLNKGQTESKRDIDASPNYPWKYSDFRTNPQEYIIKYKP